MPCKQLQKHPEDRRKPRDPQRAAPQPTPVEGGQPVSGQAGQPAGKPAATAAPDVAMGGEHASQPEQPSSDE